MYCLQDNTYIDIYIAPLQDYLLRSAPAETLAKENSKLQCCACKTYAFNKDVWYCRCIHHTNSCKICYVMYI